MSPIMRIDNEIVLRNPQEIGLKVDLRCATFQDDTSSK